MSNAVHLIPADGISPPTIDDWKQFMDAMAAATVDTFVRVVVYPNTADPPTTKEFAIPASWFTVKPMFVVTPPEQPPPDNPPPPPPQPVTMYVTSTNGMWTHSATDTNVGSRVGSFAFRAAVKVNPDTTPANGYIWRIIAAGEPAAGLFIAEKTSDGATVLLSTSRP